MTKAQWSASDVSKDIPMRSSDLDFQSDDGEFHDFTIIATAERIVFGGVCNTGFLESGYLIREDHESLDESLNETLADLETYYNDGPRYVSRIVCNDRM